MSLEPGDVLELSAGYIDVTPWIYLVLDIKEDRVSLLCLYAGKLTGRVVDNLLRPIELSCSSSPRPNEPWWRKL